MRAFVIVALAPVTIAAGRSAHTVLVGGSLPTSQLVFNAGLLLSLAALVTAPLLVFTPTLMQAWRRAAFDYGALAERMGIAFEDKWLRPSQHVDLDRVLEQQDFSATTDLYAVVANIYEMRLIAIDVKSLVMLLGAMLLPFVPVVLLAVPMNDILSGLKALLL